MTPIEDFYARVAVELTEILVANGARFGEIRRWILIDDKSGLAVSSAAPDAEPWHEILAGLIERGAHAAAVVHYFPSGPGGPERLLAQVYTTSPSDSDVRRADVMRDESGAPTLSTWQHTV
jgi:hypothetical protein